MTALEYLRNHVSAVVNHSDEGEANEFKQLIFALFAWGGFGVKQELGSSKVRGFLMNPAATARVSSSGGGNGDDESLGDVLPMDVSDSSAPTQETLLASSMSSSASSRGGLLGGGGEGGHRDSTTGGT